MLLARLAPLLRWAAGDSISALAGTGVVFLLFCMLVQGTTGAWNASFNAYPDEPSHFISAVMIRDYLVSGFSLSPTRFAENYYQHYPFFAVGYWPPLYYLISALVFLIAGVGRFQALLVSAWAAAGSAWIIYIILRKRTGYVVACCGGLLFLSLAEVQRWMSAVMTDEMVVFFCLAACVRLLAYLDRPTLWNGIFCGACCGFATLTKYSGAYVCFLPIATCLILRRFSPIAKSGFAAMHATMIVIICPWLLWMGGRASTGLPPLGRDPIISRLIPFTRTVLDLFSPVLLVIVVLGLLALVMMPRVWRADLLVVLLLSLGSLALLIESPVDPEQRYVLAVAAALLVLALSGWSGVAEYAAGRRGVPPAAFPILAVCLTASVAAANWGAYQRPPSYPIRSVVKSVIDNPAWDHKRIAVAADLEGPMIAEFVVQDVRRPAHELVRPSKLLSRQGWFGENYVSLYSSAEEVAAALEKDAVGLIIWHSRPAANWRKHELLMDQMLHDVAFSWHDSASFSRTASDEGSWSVYEFAPRRQQEGTDAISRRQ